MEEPTLEEYEESMIKILNYLSAVIGEFQPFELYNGKIIFKYRIYSSSTRDLDHLDKSKLHRIGMPEDYHFSKYIYEYKGHQPTFKEISKLIISSLIKENCQLTNCLGKTITFPDNFYKLILQLNLMGL